MLDYQRLTPHSQAARGKVKALGMLGIHRLTARTPVLGRQKGRYRQRLGSKWAPRYGGFYRQEQISYICIYIYIYVCIYIYEHVIICDLWLCLVPFTFTLWYLLDPINAMSVWVMQVPPLDVDLTDVDDRRRKERCFGFAGTCELRPVDITL